MKKHNSIPRIYSTDNNKSFHTENFNKLLNHKKQLNFFSDYKPMTTENYTVEEKEVSLANTYKKLKEGDETKYKGQTCIVVENNKEQKEITLIENKTDEIHTFNY